MNGLTVTLGLTRATGDIPAIGKPGQTRYREPVPGQIGGYPVTFDLRKGPHVLISGMTGSGKSVAVHNVLGQLLDTRTPDDLSVLLIDPKRVELACYAGLPHVVSGRAAQTPQDALRGLEWALGQVEARFAVMERYRARDVAALAPWGAPIVPLSALQDAGCLSRNLLVAIDELADLVMSEVGGAVEGTLARILQLGRAAGVSVLAATQSPRADVLSGLLRSNLPSRYACALRTATESRIALDMAGAEKLTGCGDALWLPAGARIPIRLQGAMDRAVVNAGV